jgi:hypothetical protein
METPRIDYLAIITNYGIAGRMIKYKRCLTFIRDCRPLAKSDGHKYYEILPIIIETILAYHWSCVKNRAAMPAIDRFKSTLRGTLVNFCGTMKEPVVDFDRVYSRRVFYFDREQLRFIRRFDWHLAAHLEAISGIDADAALCLREVAGRDLTGLIIEFVMAIRNGQQRAYDSVRRARLQ